MCKKVLFASLLLFHLNQSVNGQNGKVDSLKLLLDDAPADTNRVKVLLSIVQEYYFSIPDSSIVFAEKALTLATDLDYYPGEKEALNNAGEALRLLGDFPRSLKMQFKALLLNRNNKDLEGEARSLGFIGYTYLQFGEYKQALQYLMLSHEINQRQSSQMFDAFVLSNVADVYYLLNKPDTALFYLREAWEKYTSWEREVAFTLVPLKSAILIGMGNVYSLMGKKDTALQFYHAAIFTSAYSYDRITPSRVHAKIAELYESLHQYDSSLYYSRLAYAIAKSVAQKFEVLGASELLVRLHKQSNNLDSAFYYQNVVVAMKDSLYGSQKFKQLQLLMLDEQEQQQETLQEQERYKNRTNLIALWSTVGVFLVIALILFRNNRKEQKANHFLEKTLSDLRATQSQLIQSEKMASLGELTAGIAHEIQNPLNFVNNFSEVNKELFGEMKEEIEKGNYDEVKIIAKDIEDNEGKISHHGKRAASIVSGMLQHSRSSSGVKEPTDINALCDEYLRLSYHGLRAKDKSFNATMKTDFDKSIGNINIIPQDIGRVVLNLLNNAFYVVNEKKTLRQAQEDTHYEPTVSISTKKTNGKVEIRVADNGNGIPQKVLDKIFQPFFTTKPTGQGTGLGLSLSYDIIKAHGGEINVETKEGQGTTFIISLSAQ